MRLDYEYLLDLQNQFAEHYKYRKLPEVLSRLLTYYYEQSIPEFLDINGADDTLCTIEGTPITQGYDRIVIGDFGAYIEFSIDQVQDTKRNFKLKQGQEYRLRNPQFSQKVKYVWYTAKDNSGVKIYWQKKEVSYADYEVDKFYVSVYEVQVGNITEDESQGL